MAIHFITGRIGGGKGLYCMRLLVAEIRATNRKIITNFPVLLDELNTYLHKEYGEGFDILDRFVLIESKEEIRNFFRIRKQDKDGPVYLDEELDQKGRQVAYDIAGAQTGGVYYLLDEVHIVFGARDWMSVGRAVMFYATQHRKLGDDVIMVSQVPKQVDSQFRNLAQDFTVLRNHGMEKFFFFKQPGYFTRNTFLNMPTNDKTKDAMETSVFKLDIAQADCYETERGVGLEKVEGQTADKHTDKRKGLPFWLLFVGLAVIIAVIFWVPVKGIPLASEKLLGTKKGRTNIVNKVTNVVAMVGTNELILPPTVTLNTNLIQAQAAAAPVVSAAVETVYSEITVVGYGKSTATGDFFVILSNFVKLSIDTGSLASVHTTHVVDALGIKYKYEFGFLDINRLLK